MGLKNMSLLEHTGTTISATGGPALVFAEDGVTITNGVHLIVPADMSYTTRRQCTAKVKQPNYDPKTGQYSKDKKSLSFAQPVVLSDGRIVYNTIRVEREVHPGLDAVEAAGLNIIGAQLLCDADTANFWATGALS